MASIVPFTSGALAAVPGPRGSDRRASRSRWSRLPGSSAAGRRLEDAIARVAEFGCATLVTGETGCGKEEVARAIHAAGDRSDRPFIAVNCGSLVSSLAESQLFGHEKGSFTGASGSSRGAFRAAEGGVLLLDEIGEMPLDLQTKLLRVLDRREVTPVGTSESHATNVQVIAATNRDLDAAVEAGEFREDLLFRLNTVHLVVPPLRDCPEDIPHLIEHFAAHYAGEFGRPQWSPAPDVMKRFICFPWPGNVRQLAQVIERMYVFEDRAAQMLDELFQGVTSPPAEGGPASAGAGSSADDVGVPLPSHNLDELRRIAVRQVLAATGGHRGKAAAILGVSSNTLRRLVDEAMPGAVARTGRPRGRSGSPGRPR